MKSVLRFDHQGIAYAAVMTTGSFVENTSFSFHVVGNYSPGDVYKALSKIIKARNTNSFDNAHTNVDEGYNYFSKFTESVGLLDFNYLGSGSVSITVNKCRVLFHGEVNLLRDFTKKCLKAATIQEQPGM